MSRNFIPGTKVMIDVSELRRIDDPFKNRVLGGIRKHFYQLSALERRILRLRQLIPEEDLLVERLSRMRKWKPYRGVPQDELNNIPWDDYAAVKEFMKQHDLTFYICHFDYWRRKKKTLAYLNYDLIFNNYRYMLFSLEAEEEPE
jgi:hypothetical protein